MASLSFTSVSYNSFKVRVTGMSTSNGTKGIIWYVDGEEYADWTDYDIAEDDTSSDRLTVDGLKPGTEYEVQAVIYYSDGIDDYDVIDTIVTDLYDPDFSSTEVVLRGSASDSLTVRVEGLDTDYSGTWILEFFIYNEYGDELDTISKSRSGGYSYSSNVTFDNLDPSTEYYIDVKIFFDYGDDQESTWIDGIYCTTEDADEEYYQPSYDNISVDVSAGDSSITVHVSGFDTAYDDVWRVSYSVTEKETGTNIVNLTLRSDNDLSFNNVTFDSADGILPGTTYQVLIMLVPYPDVDSGVDSWVTWTPYEVTTGGSSSVDRPAKFTWADGTTTKTSGQEFDITADEWSDLLDNVNEVLEYKNESQATEGNGTNEFTYPDSGDVFAALMYNQVLYQLYMLDMMTYQEYLVSRVTSGSPVTAEKINYLVSTLNSIA